MAKPHERVFALVGALLFLASSIGVTVFVVLQMQQENKIKRSENQATPNEQQDPQNQLNKQTGAKMLEGTKLQNFTPQDSVPELKIQDTVVGTGEEVKEGATVTAHYTGALVKDGTIFQSSKDGPNQPIEFPLSGVIPGWTKGVPGMKVGGIRRLIIPAAQAYGSSSPSANIPANSDLVFDIEITAVKNP